MTNDNSNQPKYFQLPTAEERRKKHLLLGGLIILAGVLLLGRKLGLFFVGIHIWPLFLIGIGVVTGLKHRFTDVGSWMLIGIGIFFLVPKFVLWGVWSHQLAGPLALIAVGSYLAFRRQRGERALMWAQNDPAPAVDSDNFAVEGSFSEKHINVNTQNLSSGNVKVNFSESRINLLEASIEDMATIYITANFSEVEVIVPAEWHVTLKSEHHFSTAEDRRWQQEDLSLRAKQLVIQGKYSFSKLIIKSR
ncbi:MAG: hypothetical protein EOP49_24265 [Sphingobacteriales bacterium]|nr:MAG: hypothetical protein EOP49_24265 [Sphingobacteriales bacterium]